MAFLLAAGVQYIGDPLPNLAIFLGPVIESVFIGFHPAARIQHLSGIAARRPGNTHPLLPSPNRQIASRITVRLASGISRRLGRWIHPAPVFAVTR
ncbi:Uncharacterised protein [Mycobacterium tuberculosis]|uniref:Uncharacterized protein n=1 Tax=Mycobacterium tuberculosis TaxID=1773 RepID=A0A654TS22_MYCTX|nr:Uncharacterised protein [Mycobacterium tuberculosis]CNV49871.1 Uncharacterised protein [Mycobacterium tuberculosis]COV23169.1 Uncharacterised protein [Mycobacterium tuberculosis]COV67272.1 Uncharacterised protein [Mycobacterium tuberculosis]COV80885.1 Uncharacterised protein [Mycobacterium tuberculosis]